jgi:hypothetical protein
MIDNNEVIKKCKEIWFDKTKNKRIRRKEKLFTDEELKTIDSLIYWVKREKDNLKEKVMYVAHDIYEPLKCPITKETIKTYNPLYRKYSDVMIKNKCFISDRKIKEKLTFPFSRKYSNQEIEEIFRSLPANVAIRYPVILNHCWVSLENKGFDLLDIQSNEEAFYLHHKNLIEIPKCPITSEKRKFNIKGMKYCDFNSTKASHIANSIKHKGKKISETTIQKREKTMMEKYGVKSMFNIKEVKDKSIEKRKEMALKRKKEKKIDVRTTQQKRLNTIFLKYNVSSYKEYCEKYITKEITKQQQQTFKNTLKKKYNVENISDIPQIREKIKQTCVKKYGTTCALNTEEQKIKNENLTRTKTYNNFSRFKSECVPMFTLEEWLKGYDKKLPWKKTKTDEIFYCKYWGYCPVGKFKNSSLERTIAEILDNLNIEYVKNTRDIIKPQELDFFIPSHNLAIECNGEYFHSSRSKSRNYHIDKKLECEKNNIRLIHFFGKDILTKPKIVKNLLRSILKGNRIKILARKCFVKKIDNKISKKFYEKYHLQGFCNATNHYGLFYKNRLISAISIGKTRFTKSKNDIELIRYVTMNNVYVVGGFQKILSIIKKEYSGKILHTYSDFNIFTGNVYKNSGFSYIGKTDPDYYYCKDGSIFLSRYNAQKHKLKRLLKNDFNPNQTEEENMNNSGYYRIYGCGHNYYKLNL